MQIISPYLTFPNIDWWLQTVHAEAILLDVHEHYEKMSYRNRYRISGSNNSILLSIPLVNGRNQHTPIADVQITNETDWQVQHWRTMVSVYNRSPYFFHYEDSLKQLFALQVTHLLAFNKAALKWVMQQMKFTTPIHETTSYQKVYPGDYTDLRNSKQPTLPTNRYYQVFEDRIGFVPNLSILDLLFSEGPNTLAWLRANSRQL